MTAMLLRLVSADDSFRGCSGANCAALDCGLWPPVPDYDQVPLAPEPWRRVGNLGVLDVQEAS